MNSCYTIGLTGGIASGKSAVSDKFEELGCKIIDADIIARAVVERKSQGLKQLVESFGVRILADDQNLDRAKLKKIVFKDTAKLAKLNALLHPLIKEKIIQQVKQVTSSFCIIVIPLLCESTRYDWLDRVLVIDVKPETQLLRLLERDNITHELAAQMMKSQCSRKQRLAIADDVINNEHTLLDLYKNVESLNRLYKSL